MVEKEFKKSAMDEWIEGSLVNAIAAVEQSLMTVGATLGFDKVPEGCSLEEFRLFGEGFLASATTLSVMFGEGVAWDSRETSIRLFRAFAATRGVRND